MALLVGELYGLLRLDDSGFHRGMRDAESAFMSLASTAAKWTAAAAASVLGLAGAATKLAIDFEDAFAGVRKTVDASEPELARLRQGIRDMAKEIPASTREIAEVAEAAGQLGIETRHILNFTETMVNLGVATNLSGQQAATALARLANITQMPQDQFDRLGSAIVELGNSLATTEAEIVEMGLRIAGAGAQIGLTEAQILGLAGALSSVGIESQAGGSAISRVMIEVANQVASSGEQLELFAAVAGMTAAEFQRAFREDAAGAIVTFVEGLGRMGAEGQNVFAVLDELGLSEIRVRDALLRAAGAGDLMRQAIELGTQAWEENTALVQEAEQRYATTASKLQVLKNNFYDVGITVGDAVLPAFRGVLDQGIASLQRLQEWVAEHAPQIQAALERALGDVTEFGRSMLATVAPVWEQIKGVIVRVIEVIRLVWAEWGDELITIARTVFGTVWQVIQNVLGIISGLLDVFIGLFTGDWQRMADGLTAIWSNLWEAIRAVVSGAWDILKAAFGGLWDSIKRWFVNLASDAWAWGRDVIQGFLDGLKGMFARVRQEVSEFVSGIVAKVKSVLGIASPSRVFEEIGQNLGQGLVGGLESVRGAVERAAASGLVAPVLRFPPAPAVAGGAVPPGPGSVNVIVELDGRTIVRAIGQPLVEEIRLRTGVRL